MDPIDSLPEKIIAANGPISRMFLERDVRTFRLAARYVKDIPYGYNSRDNDCTLVFREDMGTCTTKHGLIARLAREQQLPVFITIGIYEMAESIVSGTGTVLRQHGLPGVPEIHCYLAYKEHRVDLTEGNCNGKDQVIEHFLYTQAVQPDMSRQAKEALYLDFCRKLLLTDPRFHLCSLEELLAARAACQRVLKGKVSCFLGPDALVAG